MPLPKNYLTSTRNTGKILASIQQAQAPKKFTVNFLENLGYKSSADRLTIGMLKGLGFLSSDGSPTSTYFEYLDQTQSQRVLANALRDAYSDLFEIQTEAYKLDKAEVKGKLKTLTQGQYSDDVLAKMATTFCELVKHADFEAVEPAEVPTLEDESVPEEKPSLATKVSSPSISGLVYSINLHLPDSRDQAVYDAIFKSLKAHLLDG